ncbi:MAG: hypothetical protein B2I17_05585 [Thermoplasmatales archaeon B_DKE]|nr:MAG: hypothetical protein B2I17_05585 [Thermoplasmatales archaeon B_DKE]QRF75196.1 hypothetical protein Thermo_00690 [Thermoplasmatales archaeon]
MTARQETRLMVDRIRKMESVMRMEDVAVFERIIAMGQIHSPEVSTSTLDSFSGFLISIILELAKRIDAMEKRLGDESV